jgi:general secretion pathway protein H
MPMSPVGSDRSRRGDNGFTLIEALVALVLLATAATVAMPRLQSSWTVQAEKAEVTELANFVAEARMHAIATQQETVVVFDAGGNRYWSTHAPEPVAMDANVRMTLTVASSEHLDDKLGAVRFFADGSATGARVRVDTGRLVAQIAVHWLTGRVAVDLGR